MPLFNPNTGALLATFAISVTTGAMVDVQMNNCGAAALNGNTVPTVNPYRVLNITHLSTVVDSGATFSGSIDLKIFKNGVDTGTGGRLTLPLSTNSGKVTLAAPIILASGDTFDGRVNHSGVSVSHFLWGFMWGYGTL